MNYKSLGILSYGAYLPKYRIKTEDIAEVYGQDPENIKSGLGIIEKTVPAKDEDTISISVNAAKQAYNRLKQQNITLDKDMIGAIYIGSESHPYAVKSSSSVVGDALGIDNFYTAADLEFACKAGTAAIQMIASHVESNQMSAGLAIGSDTAQGAPGDALEYSAACASAALILGRGESVADLMHTVSFTTDTPDFWRREHEAYPSHGGRFTGSPAYYKHIITATRKILEETESKIEDYDHVVFHMPNAKFPKRAAKKLNVSKEQLKYSLTVPTLGNSYSACSMIGLINVLDNAKPGDKILMTSYGSGAASDSFVWEVNDKIKKYRETYKKIDFDRDLKEMMDSKIYLNYGQYVNHTNKL
jgi:hydroxymethylglutaryl-CoA synthase